MNNSHFCFLEVGDNAFRLCKKVLIHTFIAHLSLQGAPFNGVSALLTGTPTGMFSGPISSHFRTAFLTVLLMFAAANVSAQQGKGLFFSVFGSDAPVGYGDFDKVQAFYFEVPQSETQPVYLRVFDAELGGNYDEKHNGFDSQTRFMVLGGNSASKSYAAGTKRTYWETYDPSDLLYNKAFGETRSADGRWILLTELNPEDGFKTPDGMLRYVLIVHGESGDDGNFFDLALSYSQTSKIPPPTSRTYVYDLTFRIPSLAIYDFEDFRGQIPIQTQGKSEFSIFTFDMDGVPVSLSVPFQDDKELEPSGDGVWNENVIKLDNHKRITQVGFNFFARGFNNSFGFAVKDEKGELMPIELPIKDYEPPRYPKLSYAVKSVSDDCSTFEFSAVIDHPEWVNDLVANWTIADSSYNSEKVRVSFDTLGVYPVDLTLKAEINGAEQIFEFTDSVVVNRPPLAYAGGDRATIPGRTIAFDGTGSGDEDGRIIAYDWDMGDGNEMSGARIDYTYRNHGTFPVTLVVTDNSFSPCGTDTARVDVKVNRPPLAKIEAPDIVQKGEEFILDGSPSEDPDGEIVDYVWQIGNDTLLSGQQVFYAFTDEMSREVILQIMDDAHTVNSMNRTRKTIKVNKLPLAFAGEDKLISPERPATFRADGSFDPDGRIVEYEWDFGDEKKYGAVIQKEYIEPGEYPVFLTVKDNSGGGFAVDTMFVTVNAPPQPVVMGAKEYLRGRVILSASDSYDPDGEIISYEWHLDGKRFSEENLEYTFDNPGTYEVELIVVDNSGTYSSVQRTKDEVKINAMPVARYDVPDVVAVNETFTLDASDSYDPDGEIYSYTWELGNGEVADGEKIDIRIPDAGVYQIQLEVRDNPNLPESRSIVYHELKVNRPPEIVVNAPDRASPGDTVTIDLSESRDIDGEISKVMWNVDGTWREGGLIKTFIVSEELISRGISVALEDDSGVSNSIAEETIRLKLNAAPVAEAGEAIRTAQRLIMLDGSESYDPDGDDLTYYWDFGDGKSSKGPVVLHNYPFGGSFQARLTVDDNRGLNNSFSYDTVDVFINRPPEVYFDIPRTICVGDEFEFNAGKTFDPDGSDLRYEWSFGDGNIARGKTGTHTFEEEGRYQVVLTVDDNEGMGNSVTSFARFINVVGSPEADAGEDFIACQNELVQFDATSSLAADRFINQYEWDFGDGNYGSGVSPSHVFAEPGEYKVTLSVTGNEIGSCANTDMDEVWVTVLPEPKAEFELASVGRTEEEITLDASASLVDEQEITRITWTIDNSETYRWEKSTRSDSVTGVTSYWELFEGDQERPVREVADESAQGKLPTITKSFEEGDHEIRLFIETTSITRCNEAQLSKFITIKDKPDVELSELPTLVPGEQFQLSARELSGDLNEIERALWSFGDGVTKEGLFVSHTYDEPGRYMITFVANDGQRTAGSTVRLEQMVLVNAAPVVKLNGPSRTLPGNQITFNAEGTYDPDGEITSYQWFFSDGARKTGEEVSHVFRSNGIYHVSLTVTDNAGAPNSVRNVSQVVRVAAPPELTLKLPTVLCPGVPVNIVEGLSIPESDSSLVEIYIGNKMITFDQAREQSFGVPGVYNLRVIMKDGTDLGAGSSVVRQTIRVNGAPEIYAEIPQNIYIGAVNEFATFNAENTFDPNGDLVRIYWEMGDGTEKMGRTVQHEYKQPGTYEVTVTAVDGNNLNCSVSEKTYTVEVVKR